MSSRRTRAFKWDIPRLGNPQEQARITLLCPEWFSPFLEEFLLWRMERSHKKHSYPSISQYPTWHPCLWHPPIPSGLEDTGIRLPKNPWRLQRAASERGKDGFFSRLIGARLATFRRSQSKLHSAGVSCALSPLNSEEKKRNLGSCQRADNTNSPG